MFPFRCGATQRKFLSKPPVWAGRLSHGGFGVFICLVPLTVTGNLRFKSFSWPIMSPREQESHCADILCRVAQWNRIYGREAVGRNWQMCCMWHNFPFFSIVSIVVLWDMAESYRVQYISVVLIQCVGASKQKLMGTWRSVNVSQ